VVALGRFPRRSKLTEPIPRTVFSWPSFPTNSRPAKHFREMSTYNRGIV
jgi:hypothetical protein